MNAYQQAAHQVHDFGFNVTAIKGGTKRPGHAWECWQSARQTLNDVNALPWYGASGLGVISGVGGLRIFDFDDCPEPGPAVRVLNAMGLDSSYPWFWPSGSGKGWGIAVRCDGELPAGVLSSNGKGPGVYKAPGVGFDHLELRWRDCQTVLPPSQHPEGPGYQWRNGAPGEPPAVVTPEQVLRAFLAVTRREPADQAPAEPHTAAAEPGEAEERAGDLYARTHSWRDILEPLGWKYVATHGKRVLWTRPGKDPKDGWSAATGGDFDGLWVWSEAGDVAPFTPGVRYSRYAAYALLYHGGDYTAAARAIYA